MRLMALRSLTFWYYHFSNVQNANVGCKDALNYCQRVSERSI